MNAVASLPMYDLPGLQAASDDWWRGLAACLRAQGIGDVPENLSRAAANNAFWRHENLLLSQTCGYPLLKEYGADLQLVATPLYAAPGCDGARYVSHVIVAGDSRANGLADLRHARCAINNWGSQSGMNALRHAVAPLAEGGKFFSQVVVSGGHLHSIAMVAAAEAEVAAIDCVSYALVERHFPEQLAQVRILTQTAPAPALPYVTATSQTADAVQRLRDGLLMAIATPDLAAAREDLLIEAFSYVPLSDYQVMLEMETEAAAVGYEALA